MTPVPAPNLAGFDLSTPGRFSGVHRGERALSARYIEASEGASVVAAAEVVAAARGKANQKAPAELVAWIKRQPAPALSKRDEKVSELRQLWQESTPTKWLTAVADLESRLH